MCDYYHWYWIIFSFFTIVGGVIGYVKAGSKASLIAGVISGSLLDLAFVLIYFGYIVSGNILGAVISLALAGKFAHSYNQKQKPFPAIPMIFLGLLGVVTGVWAILTACKTC